MGLETAKRIEQARGEDADYDLCVAWTTEFDAGFVELLDRACRARSLSLLQVTPANLERVCGQLSSGEICFRAFFDRASDENSDFFVLVDWARTHDVYRINPYELARRTWDKAAMHTAVSDAVPTPHTLFLPPYDEAPELPPDLDLSLLGPSFTIKPSHGGGGQGVVVVATNVEQIVEARKTLADDMYMLQARVVPSKLDEKTAWFRVIYDNGNIYPCWWEFGANVYHPVTVAEEVYYGLAPLRQLTGRVAEISKLQLFSTEIAIDAEGQFVVVDYVNDPIDLTLASAKPDGVPDDLIKFIAENMSESVKTELGEVE